MRKIIIPLFLCIAGSFLNVAINFLNLQLRFPLYLDTILTVSITLTCGLYWGIICGVLTNITGNTIIGGGWEGYLFIICNASVAVITWFMMRVFPDELNLIPKFLQPVDYAEKSDTANQKTAAGKKYHINIVMDRIVVLIILSFALCLAMSLLGGFIASVIISLNTSYSSGGSGITSLFGATMFKENTPIIIAEIASRIPVNIVDRLISAFAGFGIALGIKKSSSFLLR